MSSVEEFRSKLKSMMGGSGDSNSSSKLKKETYIIPEEFKGHYSGKWGECDYDTRMYEVIGSKYLKKYLHYKTSCRKDIQVAITCSVVARD